MNGLFASATADFLYGRLKQSLAGFTSAPIAYPTRGHPAFAWGPSAVPSHGRLFLAAINSDTRGLYCDTDSRLTRRPWIQTDDNHSIF